MYRRKSFESVERYGNAMSIKRVGQAAKEVWKVGRLAVFKQKIIHSAKIKSLSLSLPSLSRIQSSRVNFALIKIHLASVCGEFP